MAIVFPFRDLLESIGEWLRPWPHLAAAVAALVAISAIGYMMTPPNQRGDFQPGIGALGAIPALLLGLMVFVGQTWLWISMGALLGASWLAATIISVRSFRIVSTWRWRAALVGLVIAVTLSSLSIVNFARRSTIRSIAEFETSSREAREPFIAGAHAAPEWLRRPPDDSPPNSSSDYRPDESVTPPADRKTNRALADAKQDSDPSLLSRFLKDREQSDAPLDLDSLRGVLTGGKLPDYSSLNAGATYLSDRFATDRLSDILTSAEFIAALPTVAICLGLCVLAAIWNWLLDFPFDVLHYGSHDEERQILIDGTANAVRWLSTRAPDATIVLVGHSLGSVIAAHALAVLSETHRELSRSVLVTLGSPLNYLPRLFPTRIRSAHDLSGAILPRFRWVNLWRRRDVIGKALDIDGDGFAQYCVGSGGHAGYWSDGNVWKAVAHEVASVRAATPVPANSTPHCVVETRLGAIVGVLTAALLALGVLAFVATK